MMLSKGTWRYDVLDNDALIADDVIVVAPFNDTVVYMGSFPASVILQVNQTINKGESKFVTWRPMLPDYILIGDVIREEASSSKLFHLYSHDFDAKYIQTALKTATVEIKETPFRSTLIWLAFVEEYWSCDGVLGKFSDWFTTPQHSGPGSSNKWTHNKQIAIVGVSLLLACIVVAVSYCLLKTVRCILRRGTIEFEEFVNLKGDVRKDEAGECSETSYEDDHEIL
jgi:hypothetical protein